MKEYKRFLINTFLIILIFAILISSVILFIGNRFIGKNVYTKGAANIRYWVNVKNERAKELDKQGNKIVFLSGSNTLHGLDSKYASEKTGLPVLNYGLHAAFDIYMFEMGKQILNSGDIVVLPLEFVYYSEPKTSSLQAPFAEYVISYMPEYYQKSSFPKKIGIVMFLAQTYIKNPKVDYSENENMEEYKPQLNDYGDFIDHIGTTEKFMLNKGAGSQISQNIPKNYNNFPLYDFIKYCKENNIKTYAIMPNYYRDKEFTKEEEENFNKIKAFYDEQGVTFIGSLKDGSYTDKNLFSDTGYHTNEKGTKQRTDWIIDNVLSVSEIKNINK